MATAEELRTLARDLGIGRRLSEPEEALVEQVREMVDRPLRYLHAAEDGG